MDSAKSTEPDELDKLAREVLFDQASLPVLVDALIERGILRVAPLCLRMEAVPNALCRSCGSGRPDYRGAAYCKRWIESSGQRELTGAALRDDTRLRSEALRWAKTRHDMLYDTVGHLVHGGVVVEGVSRIAR